MRRNECTPTASQTYDSLMKISEIVNRALRDMGKIEGKNREGSEEELRKLVLDVSKKIAEQLPIYQLENDELDHAEAILTHALVLAEDPNAFRNNDFEVVG